MHVRRRSRWLALGLVSVIYVACSNDPPAKEPDPESSQREEDGFNSEELHAIGELLDADVQSDGAGGRH